MAQRRGVQVRMSEQVRKDERERLFAEIKMLKQLKHKNIMTFFDSWMDPKSYHINFITELFTSGTLRQCAPLSRAACRMQAFENTHLV